MRRAKLEDKLYDVSDPSSPNYKRYLRRSDIVQMLRAPEDKGAPFASDAIKAYLTKRGLSEGEPTVSDTRDMVSVKLNALAAEAFFATELHHWAPEDPDAFGRVDMIRVAAPYSIPADLADHVSFVDKLVRLPRLEARKVAPGVGAAQSGPLTDDDSALFNSCTIPGTLNVKCSEATTPAVLAARYQLPAPQASYTPGNKMACAEFQLQGVDSTDLNAFSTACGVAHVQVDTTVGQNGPAGVEALLDVEYIEAVAAPIPLEVINSASYSILDWATSINNNANSAWVQSVSYGNDEIQQTSTEYMYECNTQFMGFGARGISVLIAAGDQGVWGRTGHTTPNGAFHPDFPASSPYVTAVGGTQFLTTSVLGEETTWADGGGGFSNTFEQPAYQASAVAAYFKSGVQLPNPSQYNATGRAYPDVSALAGVANGYCVAYKGTYGKVGGTSAATPVFAGTIALLNDALLAAGDATMGFLNPWIYGTAGPAGVFNDVTTGENNEGYSAGFFATKGWDPATGYGTPIYPSMLSLVMKSAKNRTAEAF